MCFLAVPRHCNGPNDLQDRWFLLLLGLLAPVLLELSFVWMPFSSLPSASSFPLPFSAFHPLSVVFLPLSPSFPRLFCAYRLPPCVFSLPLSFAFPPPSASFHLPCAFFRSPSSLSLPLFFAPALACGPLVWPSLLAFSSLPPPTWPVWAQTMDGTCDRAS
uniref:(northern house mosquito) hypothetical protein n=1 Tax=Culex pipiens TaxID=7175 RepID=A0A8D8F4T1_CULPI